MAVNWRKIFTSPYSDKTHFIYELIQNADDSKSTRLEFHLCENGLIVWNDGRQFTEKDKESICSIGFSNKDLTQIGTFGMGITAVFTYTDCLEVYSGDKYFRIQIKDPTKPENIDFDAIDSTIIEQLGKGRTVFRLPFRERLREKDITKLRDRLCNLGEKRPLLFLRHLERVAWRDELGAQVGTYFCQRCRRDKMQNASEVELITSLDDNNQRSETFLIFRKEAQPPQNVVAELLLQAAEDEDEHQRIQRSAEKLQPVEVAFRLQNDKITAMTDRCMLFSYLSTQKETRLRFIIQARYQTTLARDNIEEMEDNLWNEWLVTETANYLPEVLEQLKAGGLLELAFFNVLPLREDDKVGTDDEVPLEFEPIVKALEDAMREKLLVPIQDGGYAKAENVFYPKSSLLRKLVKSSGMHSDSSLLHSDIGKDGKEFGRCFGVMVKAGVKEIKASDLLSWLEKKSCKWFKNKTNKWLCSLYIYFNRKWSKSELERIRELPLVRLENGEHVCVSDQLVYFPPETDEDIEDIKPLLNDLRILKSTLLRKEGYNDIKTFLRDIGVEKLNPENLITESICPLYSQPNKPLIRKNRRHVHYIFKSWQKVEGFERNRLEKSVGEVPILRVYKGIQREASDFFVVPCDAYLPQAYTGDNDLETYFSVSDGDIWFVDDKYLTKNSDTKAWLQFLKAIGAMDTPRVIKKNIPVDYKECSKRSIQRAYITRTGEETIEDHSLYGLSAVLNAINEHRNVKLSQVLWSLLVKALPLAEQERETFFKLTYKGTYYSKYRSNSYIESDHFDADFYRQLKETAWIPDEPRDPRKPSKCFAPTSENRELLGNIVSYLPDSFNTNSAAAKWLADKLEVRLNADTDNVLNYLQTMRSQKEVSVEDVEPIYKFLESEDADLRRFEKESLIFTPEPEPRWWQTHEVFWVNESPVFGDHCGYLADYYGDPLKEFFTGLGVRERATPSDYIRVIRDIASAEVPEDSEVRERVQELYRCLWRSLQKNGDSLEDKEWQEEWEQLREEACWLGREGDKWNFFSPQDLFWKDDDYRSDLFKNKVPFWRFDDDLLEFAKELGVKGCYQVSDVEFDYYGGQSEDKIWSEKVQNLRPYIRDFLNSPRLCEGYKEEESAEILEQISVCRAQRLEVRYRLNGVPVSDRTPRQSFLEEKSGILWLGLEEDEEAAPDLIGDALQESFRINQLREFVKDLLPSVNLSKSALLSWKRRGFQADLCLLPPDSTSKEDENNLSELIDEKSLNETDSEDNSWANDSEIEASTVYENPETENEDDDSTENESGTPTYKPRPGRSGTRPRGGTQSSTPNRNRGTGYSGGGGSGPSEEHEDLKDYIADNPSELGNGLKLVKKEYTFKLGGRVDILLQDSSGNPVTVEVKPYYISPESNDEVWQALRYKHVAAAEYGLRCDQVRSILAAPEIHDDVKAKCKQLGIEVFEKIQR